MESPKRAVTTTMSSGIITANIKTTKTQTVGPVSIRASYPPKSMLSTPLISTAKVEIIAKIFTFLSMNISLIAVSSITHFMPEVGVEPTSP